MSYLTNAVPKPKSTKTPRGKSRNSTADTFLTKSTGTWGEHVAFSNLLNSGVDQGIVQKFTCKDGYPKDDGRIERTYHIQLVSAKHYDSAAEKPLSADREGDVYCLQSRADPRIFKIGKAIDVQRRKGQLNRQYDDTFKRLWVKHSDDAFALEHWLHTQYASVLVPGTLEFFTLTDEMLDEIYAL